MTARSTKTNRLRTRHWAGLGAVALLGLLVAAGWWVTQQRVWTDHAEVRISDDAAKVRRIVWTPAERLNAPFNSEGAEYEPAVSPDARRLFFVRGRPGGEADLYVAERRDDGAWGEPQPLSGINSDADELGPRLTPDGRWLLFYSDRPGGQGRYDLWAAPRRGSGWGDSLNLGPEVNSPFNEFSPAPAPDGRQLYFSSDRKTAPRADPDEAWEATIRARFHQDYDVYAASLGPAEDAKRPPALADAEPVDALNTPHREGAVAFSPAGDFLYFTSNRPGGLGGFDLYRAHRVDGEVRFIENLGPEVNTPANETDPRPTMTGFRLYFSSDRPEVEPGQTPKADPEAAPRAAARGERAKPQAAPRSYDLFSATSREVWAEREGGLPELGWNWWVLAVLLALLAAWLLFIGAPTDRQLSLLQKCLAIALAIHLLLLLLFSAIPVVTQIVETMREEAGEQMAVNLEIARKVEMQVAARSQMTDLPSPEPEAPSAAGPTAAARPMQSSDAPKPVDVELPRQPPRPNQMQVQPRAPRREPEPRETQPQPRAQPTRPPAEVEPAFQTRRVRQTERPARAEAQQPIRNPASRAEARVQPSRARPVEVDADRAQPRPQSLASAPDVPDRPDEPVQPTVQARAAPTNDAVQAATPRADRVVAPAEASPSSEAEPDLARPRAPAAAAPMTRARRADLRLPEARQATRSLAVDTALPEPSDRDAPAEPVEARAVAEQATPSVALDTPQPVASAPEAGPAAQTPESVERRDDRPAARAEAGRPASTRAGVAAASDDRRSQARNLAMADPEEAMLPADPVAVRDDADAESIDAALPFASRRAATAEATPASPTARPVEARPRPARRADPRAAPHTSVADLPRADPDNAPPHALASAAAIASPDEPGAGSAEMVQLNPTLGGLDAPVGPTARTSPRSLAHRAFEQRQKLLRKHGGNEQSETAVARALAYLAQQQEPGGRWTYVQGNRPPGKRNDHHHDLALTALATLCYLGADHTPDKPGPYRQAVARGIEWMQPAVDKLIKRFKSGHNPGSRHRNMYDLGIATIALAEAAAMTGDPKLRDAAHRAADFIVDAQHEHAGGWRYRPNDAGDTSVVGWQVMALVSAQRTGFDITAKTRRRALKYLDNVAKGPERALAAYQPDRHHEPAMAAEALFSRFALDAPPEDKALRRAQRYFLQHKPGGKDDLYYYYYASLALMQRQDQAWKQWNNAVRRRLVERQIDQGPHAGSWDHRPTEWGDRGGRIYATAMACLTLEVYYRYLPMLNE